MNEMHIELLTGIIAQSVNRVEFEAAIAVARDKDGKGIRDHAGRVCFAVEAYPRLSAAENDVLLSNIKAALEAIKNENDN